MEAKERKKGVLTMSETLEQIATCIERGKVNAGSPYPPDMKGQDGADELTKKAIDEGIPPADILEQALIAGLGMLLRAIQRGETVTLEQIGALFDRAEAANARWRESLPAAPETEEEP